METEADKMRSEFNRLVELALEAQGETIDKAVCEPWENMTGKTVTRVVSHGGGFALVFEDQSILMVDAGLWAYFHPSRVGETR